MAAPTPSVRATPGGIFLHDGHSSKIAIALDLDISLWEKTVKGLPADNGDPIDTTTMHNVDVRTRAPRALNDFGPESSMVCAYDPDCYNQILAIIGQRTTITEIYPDGSTLAYYGYLRGFDPADRAEGTFPEATVTIVSTNWDHVNRVEALPVLTSVAGT